MSDDTTPEPELRLYVWPKFAPDYRDGLAFAIAESEEHAKRLILGRLDYDPMDWGPCEEHPLSVAIGFGRHGGG